MALTFALLLDALLGEPRWLWSRLPHPAVLMGRLIGWADERYNQGDHRKWKGVALTICLLGLAILTGKLVEALPGFWAETVLGAILLAQRSLVDHVRAVATALAAGPDAARQAVAQIVGRDTQDMDTPAIARAAIESAAENFSDGVLAPAFWFAIAGLPGILSYKIINTADSMIGYRTERHRAFGWAAARLDDLLNLLPARLTALLFAALTGGLGALKSISADAALHRSPNAGWPEAAMARALGVALSGPRAYHGTMRDFPFVNASGRKEVQAADIHAACRLLWWGWLALVALSLLLWLA